MAMCCDKRTLDEEDQHCSYQEGGREEGQEEGTILNTIQYTVQYMYKKNIDIRAEAEMSKVSRKADVNCRLQVGNSKFFYEHHPFIIVYLTWKFSLEMLYTIYLLVKPQIASKL